MSDPAGDYLIERIDRPLAWVLVFGLALTVAGIVIGYQERTLVGALIGVPIGFACGAAIGAVFGGIAWVVCRLVGGLDRLVKRPDLFGINLHCARCDYGITPEGPWRVRDCMKWPERCPECDGRLVMRVPDCPACGRKVFSRKSIARDMLALVRVPKTLDQALWGHFTCRGCDSIYDKWGRLVRKGNDMESV